jgi:hypothetical protein
MTQNETILTALKKGPITPVEAMAAFGIMRLAARVAELRESGHTINTETVHAGGKHYARYRLVARVRATEVCE